MARQKLYQISASETPKSSQLLLPSLILPPDSFPLLQVSPPALQTCRLQPNSPCPKRKKSGESLPHIKNPRTQLTDSAHLLWLPCVHDSRSPQIDFSSCRRNLRRIRVINLARPSKDPEVPTTNWGLSETLVDTV